MKKCPYCFNEMDIRASICPSCKKKVGPVGKDGIAKKRTSFLTWVATIFIGLFLLGILSTMFESSKKLDTGIAGIDSIDVYIAAKRFVEKRLKRPHTAEFAAHLISNIEKIDSNSFSVTSYVDSQNDFGASTRTNFKCTVRHLGNKKWELVDVKTW